MKRRAAPRLLTALIATVLVGTAAMPGAAVAETPDSTTPETSETPATGSQQPDETPTPSPDATVTPTPDRTSEKPAPDKVAQPAETPESSPTVKKPEAERDDTATPASFDVMPDGPLKRCITRSLAGQEATLDQTKKLTSVSIDPSCALPDVTPDPSDLPAMDDWKGVRFLAGVTELTVAGFDGVTVPRNGLGGLAKIEKLSLADNRLTELPDLGALPELKSLDLAGNDLTELTMPSADDAPRLTKLDVSKNQISDVSGVTDAVAGTTIIVTDQKLTHPDITARATQQLADLVTVPEAWTSPSWKPGKNQMAAVDVAAGSFSAARPGAWSLSWTFSEGKVSFSGSASGESTEPEPEQISFTKPGAVAVGESATYRADVSNLPTDVRPELDYQWYRGSSKSALKPVEGATDQVFTIDSVDPEDDGSFVKLVATAEGAAHQSVPALLAVQPDIQDEGFRQCVEDELGDDYDTDDLAGLRSLDCSGRGIDDVNDLPTIDDDGNVSIDLSDNLITDISLNVLVSDDGVMRTKQLNLSDNQITDVTDLGDDDVDLSDAPANLIVLDGNQIRDVSSLENDEAPDDLDPAPISVRRQVVNVDGGQVGEPVPVPPAVPVAGGSAPLTENGSPRFGPPFVFGTPGVKALKWDVPVDANTDGVAFTGTFVVPVEDDNTNALLGLIFPTDDPTGGDRVAVRGFGFDPGEVVSLRAESDDALFDAKEELLVTADDQGSISTTFTLGYSSGDQVVTAVGQQSDRDATFEFTLTNDETVEVPDDGLRTCITDEIGEGPDAESFYLSQLSRITVDFSCRNAGVEDLTGLGAVPSPSIDLAGNDVASLDTVPALSEATTSLSLNNNELDKLGEVAKQPNLGLLNLSQNRLTNFSALDDVTFAEDAQILAVGQAVRLPQRVVGERSAQPVVRGLDGERTELDYPEQARTSVTSVTWTAAGDFRVEFELEQDAQNDDDSEEPGMPGLDLTGTFAVRVVNAAIPPTTQPPSTAPAQQTSTSPRVPSLAPARLVERVERPDEDRKTAPRAVALGPEVALEETSPAPRTVTNPTVEKREPVTSVAGWGLTATGWSLLGAALLAMALAVGVAVLTLGRSAR